MIAALCILVPAIGIIVTKLFLGFLKAEIRGFVESLNFYSFSVSQFFVYTNSTLLVIIFLSSKTIERLLITF